MLLTPGIDHFLDGPEFGQQLSGEGSTVVTESETDLSLAVGRNL